VYQVSPLRETGGKGGAGSDARQSPFPAEGNRAGDDFSIAFCRRRIPYLYDCNRCGKNTDWYDGRSRAGSDTAPDGGRKKQLINKNEVETIIPVKKSSMPDGLLNLLSKEEAIQLFRYLGTLPEGASQGFRHTTSLAE